jgi:putative SOS response-associated peptidase YedK
MVEDEMSSYIRATGAEIDLEQFEEIFGQRVSNAAIKIPRCVDQWFEHPKGAKELQLRNLIMAHRAARIAEMEAALAKQRDRLAEAKEKLQVKRTKTAEKDERIATDKIADFEKKLPLMRAWQQTKWDDRIFPMNYAPIVMHVDGKPRIRLARYHCRQNGQPASIDKERDGLYNARRNNLSRWWRNEFSHSHAVMLMTSFFENVDRDGKNAVIQFTPEPAGVMLVACIYSVWKDPAGGKDLLSFALVTDDPPPEVKAAGHDRCPISLAPAAVGRWLTPSGRSQEELQQLLDERERPYYGHAVLAA